MRYKKPWLCLALCGLLLLPQMQAQSAWGRISAEEWALESYDPNPQAAALVLFDQGSWQVNEAQATLSRHLRIKILSAAGLSAARQSLWTAEAQSDERIQQLKAQTFLPGATRPGPLDARNIRRTRTADGRTHWEFDFPQVAVGAIVELSYKLQTRNLTSLQPWYAQLPWPVRRSELRLAVNRPRTRYATSLTGNHLRKVGEGHWQGEDLPAWSDLPFSPNPVLAKEQVRFRMVRRPGNWEELNAELMDRVKPKILRQDIRFFEDLVRTLTRNQADLMAKLNSIYQHVRDRMQWDGTYALELRSPLRELYLRRKANGTEINALLHHLLDLADLNPLLVLTSTPQHGPLVNEPIWDQFNHLLVCVVPKLDGIYLDAIHSNRPWFIPNPDLVHEEAWLIGEAGGRWVRMKHHQHESHVVQVQATLSEQHFHAQVSETLTGSNTWPWMSRLRTENPAQVWAEHYPMVSPSMIAGLQVVTRSEASQTLQVQYPLQAQAYVEPAGEMVLLRPLLHQAWSASPFAAPERRLPVQFAHTESQDYLLNLMIPAGYEVQVMPPNRRIVLQDSSLQVAYICQAVGNLIQVKYTFERRRSQFPVEAYPALRNLYSQVAQIHEAPIILRKREE